MTQHATHQFAGFDDYVEVFRSGTHEDSAKNVRVWSHADLDQIIDNHSPDHPAPIGVGHPEADAPAYGWAQALKREGDVLLAKFNQVQPAFADLVREGRYRNRSVKIVRGANGLQLAHVGFLGAAPPAIEGLKPMLHQGSAAGETYEFGMAAQTDSAWRRLRDRVVAFFDTFDEASLPASFSKSETHKAAPTATDPKMETTVTAPAIFTQADLDAEKTATASERTKREAAEKQVSEFRKADALKSAQAFVTGLVKANKLLPAQAIGAAEFLAVEDEASTFEFSVGDGAGAEKKTAKRGEFLRALLDSLPVQIKTGRAQAGTDTDAGAAASTFTAAAGAVVDPAQLAIHDKAMHYAAEHKCDYLTAVKAVSPNA